MQRIQKNLQPTGAKGIGIFFRVSHSSKLSITCIPTDLARETKINLKERDIWNICYKGKVPFAVGFEPTTFKLEVQHASPLRHEGFMS